MANDQDEGTGNRNTTRNHELIRSHVTDNDGYPAHAEGTEGEGDQGLLRIGSVNTDDDDDLKEISWEEFFEEFEEKDLTYLFRADADREVGRLVSQDGE